MEQALFVSSVLLWAIVLFNLLLTLVLVRRLNSSPTQKALSQLEGGLSPGEHAPDFVAETLDGEKVTLAKFLGRSVVFVFIAPDCGPCRASLPTYEELRSKANRAGSEFVFVSVGDHDSTLKLAQEFGIGSPVLIAPERSNPFLKDYRMRGTPSYTLVGPQGLVQSAGFPNAQSGDWKKLTDSWEVASPSTNGVVSVPVGERG
jgi:peroxiredoxin